MFYAICNENNIFNQIVIKVLLFNEETLKKREPKFVLLTMKWMTIQEYSLKSVAEETLSDF